MVDIGTRFLRTCNDGQLPAGKPSKIRNLIYRLSETAGIVPGVVPADLCEHCDACGDGPVGHPFLFQREDPAKLLLGTDGADVQRNAEGTAVIGDPRNDSHVLMSQMHLAFARAHNAFVDQARAARVADDVLFETAARELRWHYQCVVTREFLPRLVGDDLMGLVLAGDRRVYRPSGAAFIPLECADAAYRYGHSQIRHRYQVMRDRLSRFSLISSASNQSLRTIEWTGRGYSTFQVGRRRNGPKRLTVD